MATSPPSPFAWCSALSSFPSTVQFSTNTLCVSSPCCFCSPIYQTWGPEAFARRTRTKIHNFGAPLPPWENKEQRPTPAARGIPKSINIILLGPTGEIYSMKRVSVQGSTAVQNIAMLQRRSSNLYGGVATSISRPRCVSTPACFQYGGHVQRTA